MNRFVCKKEKRLTPLEKQAFEPSLKESGFAGNIWDWFDALISLATAETDFFYLKVSAGKELVGIGLFLNVQPYDLSASNSHLKNKPLIKPIMTKISNLLNHRVYFSFRFLAANLTRPFFFKDTDHQAQILEAMLTYIKEENEANMVIVMDAAQDTAIYSQAGFNAYQAPSETWIDPGQYTEIGQYLKLHRSLKKHVAQKKQTIVSEIINGPIPEKDIGDMMACMRDSMDHSKMSTPLQNLFEEKIYDSELFTSAKYIFINIRLEGKIVGFTNYIISGDNMAAIIGGYNRDYTSNNYIYERLFVSSLDYAIKRQIARLSYGMVDNLTKLRLTEAFDPIGLYIYSANGIMRKMIDLTHSANDISQLCCMEEKGRKKYHAA